jgi:hypothetical protein
LFARSANAKRMMRENAAVIIINQTGPILVIRVFPAIYLFDFNFDSGQKEVFWFSFAVGTIGGLIFSILGIFIYLPVFLRLGG